MTFSRRMFLKNSSVATTGICISLSLPGCNLLPPLPTRAEPSDELALHWLQLDNNGKFHFISPSQELGQGISSGFKQIIAEELGINPTLVNLHLLRTDRAPAIKATVGSESISLIAEPLARAAASMRAVLVSRAAERLAEQPANISLSDSGIHGQHASLSFAELAQGKAVVLNTDDLTSDTLRTFTTGKKKFVGHAYPTDNIEAIVTGKPLYACDHHIKGMLYGRVARPEKLCSKLLRVDERDARLVPGLVKIVKATDNVAVVAQTPMAADQAIAALRIEWATPELVHQTNIDQLMDVSLGEQDLEHSISDDQVQLEGEWTVDIFAKVPMASHMAIEPRGAVAHWQDGRVDVWSSTQDAFMVRDAIKKHLGVSADRVIVHSSRVGGSFGGITYLPDVDAARLSRAVGAPVKVQWTRPENFQVAFHRPPSTHRIRLRVDQKGFITDWWHRFKSGHVAFTSAGLPPWLQVATSVIGDFGVARGAELPYSALHTKIEFSDVRIPVDTGPWRGLGAAPNTFALESAIDAAARQMKIDPITFRLKNLTDDRLKNCLNQAAELANWQAGDHQQGRGVACGIYKGLSYVALIADVSLNEDSGTPEVTHLYCVHDCGLVINPDQVRAQIEGNLVWAMGMVLMEQIGVQAGRMNADYPGQYKIMTMANMPSIDIKLVNTDQFTPTGAGETAIIGAAAITNALSGLLDRPLTRLPICENDLRA